MRSGIRSYALAIVGSVSGETRISMTYDNGIHSLDRCCPKAASEPVSAVTAPASSARATRETAATPATAHACSSRHQVVCGETICCDGSPHFPLRAAVRSRSVRRSRHMTRHQLRVALGVTLLTTGCGTKPPQSEPIAPAAAQRDPIPRTRGPSCRAVADRMASMIGEHAPSQPEGAVHYHGMYELRCETDQWSHDARSR